MGIWLWGWCGHPRGCTAQTERGCGHRWMARGATAARASVGKDLQRCPAPARCVSELRTCSSGVFPFDAFGTFFVSKVSVLSGVTRKARPQHNIIILVCFPFSPADRMAQTGSFSNLAVEIKICLETGLIKFFYFFFLSILRPIISLKSQSSRLLLSSICRSCNRCSVATGILGYASRSWLRAVPVFLPVPALGLAPPDNPLAAWSEVMLLP